MICMTFGDHFWIKYCSYMDLGRVKKGAALIELATSSWPQATGRGRGGVNPPQDWGLVDWLPLLHALEARGLGGFRTAHKSQ